MRRARRQRVRRRLSSSTLGVRQGAAELRQEGRIFGTLAIEVLTGVFIAISLLVGIEALSTWLGRYYHLGSLFAPVSSSSYSTLVGAAVAALATFLALFFTTVGVIASTAYARVPGGVRDLFVRERTSTIYVRVVVLALVFGTALLAFPVVSARSFRGLTVVTFTALTLFSVFSLAILGRSLFNFFDPSTLSERLYPQFIRAVRSASASRRRVPDDVEQQNAHHRAATALIRYGELATLVSTRDVRDGRAPEILIYQLLTCWSANSGWKSSIPTNSEWFARTGSHPNWLTMDHNQLNMALQTRSGVAPTLSPDPLWVERRLSALISQLLPALTADGEWSRAISVLDTINTVLSRLGTRLQMDEAFLLLGVVTNYRLSLPATTGTAEDESLFRLALAERQVLGVTNLWLGLATPYENINPQSISENLDKAILRDTAPYSAGAPRELLVLLEEIAAGVAYEQRTETERITPAWWLHHLCARVMSKILTEAIASVVSLVEDSLVSPLVTDPPNDPEYNAVRIFDLLELLHKIGFHMQTVQAALSSLRSLRHAPSGDELWTDFTLPIDAVPRMERQLLPILGLAALQLPATSHDSSRPDLFGQAYRRLFDSTFRAVLNGEDDLARLLFPIVVDVASRARVRLSVDLSDQRVREQVIFGTEPLVDIMELSGYAILMTRVNGQGIADVVRETWNRVFDNNTSPDLANGLTAVLSTQENNYALTSGGLTRTGRQMELARLLRDGGIVSDFGSWGHNEQPAHNDPVVAVLAPDDMMGIHHDLADLFIVDYLANRPRPDGSLLTLTRGAERLRESIEHARRRTGVAGEGEGREDGR
jgi:hypothetical protein